MAYTPGTSVSPPPNDDEWEKVEVVAASFVYAINKSLEHLALALSCLCITPLTFPNPVMAPLLVPTLPVICDVPVLPTAPTVVNSTKFAAVPKDGAWAKLKL